mgnify:FL=1
MARVNIPVTTITRDGVAPPSQVSSVAADDHVIDGNDGRVFLEVENVDAASAHTVTVLTPGTVAGLAIADLAVSVPLSSIRWIGPFPTTVFNQTGTDDVHVDIATANLRFRAYKI